VTEPRWWAIRRASSRRPATYRCPFCNRLLHAMSEHVLISPEGDANRRRHAHADCVRRAREAGRLRTYDDWQAAHGETREPRLRLPWRRRPRS
jgi:hypothetical protein